MRGPTANRGVQYTGVPTGDLRARLDGALARLQSMDALKRSPTAIHASAAALLKLTGEQLALLRKQTFDQVTDLRAELRRRPA